VIHLRKIEEDGDRRRSLFFARDASSQRSFSAPRKKTRRDRGIPHRGGSKDTPFGASAQTSARARSGGMDDDEIDDWLDSSDDEAGEGPGATPQPSTPSFLAETTPDSTPAREAVAAAPAEEAREAPDVAEAPVGVEAAREDAPAEAPPAPPSVPTPSAVSVEPPALAVETAGRTRLAGRRGDDRPVSLFAESGGPPL
jgi:hypothetical protein